MNDHKKGIAIQVAGPGHIEHVDSICEAILEASRIKGTGIAKREPAYIRKKILEGKAIIALTPDGVLAGFCYIESWGKEKDFVANSGLIVKPRYRELGLGKMIKAAAFRLSREKYPRAKIFGLTTSLAVMKINNELGYEPVTYNQLTDDETFWSGCQTCEYYDILTRTKRKQCLCTAILFDPVRHEKKKQNERKTHIQISSSGEQTD